MRISDWSSDVCSSDLDLGIQPGQTDLYLGHFLGTSGASRFLGARQDNPAQNAAALLPEAAAANRGVFYDADGRARSVGEIYATFQRKLQNNTAGLDTLQTVVAAATPARTSTVASHLDEQRRMIDHAVKRSEEHTSELQSLMRIS